MDKKNCYLSLNKILTEELKETLLLNDLLKEENNLLPNESDQLVKLSETKNNIVGNLNAYNDKCNVLIKSCGFDQGHDGIEACINWCDNKNALQRKWEQFLSLITSCQSMNQLNGSIVDNGLRAVRQALSLLYGQTNKQQTYNASGQEDQHGLGRTIAKV
ncbi:MAG: flagellar protein FlgN [Gammaproteobacteria bacterium]|nr:flagellar protein FlgN [Gammaproteobacteria bacterium]